MDTKKVTLTIPVKRYRFFIELMKNLDFVQVEQQDTADSDEDIKKNLDQAFGDLQLLREGKLETRPANSLLDEL